MGQFAVAAVSDRRKLLENKIRRSETAATAAKMYHYRIPSKLWGLCPSRAHLPLQVECLPLERNEILPFILICPIRCLYFNGRALHFQMRQDKVRATSSCGLAGFFSRDQDPNWSGERRPR